MRAQRGERGLVGLVPGAHFDDIARLQPEVRCGQTYRPAQQYAARDDEQRRHRDLRDDQPMPEPRRPPVGRGAMRGDRSGVADGVEGGQGAEQDGSIDPRRYQRRQHVRVGDHGQQPDIVGHRRGQGGVHRADAGIERDPSQREARQAGDERQQQAFDKELPDDAAARCAQRQADGDLALSHGWTVFEPAWQRTLNEFGVQTFHMTECECRRGSFADWEQARRTELLGRLIDLIAKHTFVAIGAAMVVADYNALAPERRTRLGHPYVMCGLKAVADTLRWIDAWIDRAVAIGEWKVTEREKSLPVEFVFEAGDEGAGELASQLRKEHESGIFAGRIVRVSFESKQVGALQAADFAAYETTKQLVRTIGADERATRKSLEALVERVPYVAEYFDSRSMGELLAHAGAIEVEFSPTSVHERPNTTENQGTPETREQDESTR
jgi:hypothetical protein